MQSEASPAAAKCSVGESRSTVPMDASSKASIWVSISFATCQLFAGGPCGRGTRKRECRLIDDLYKLLFLFLILRRSTNSRVLRTCGVVTSSATYKKSTSSDAPIGLVLTSLRYPRTNELLWKTILLLPDEANDVQRSIRGTQLPSAEGAFSEQMRRARVYIASDTSRAKAPAMLGRLR